MKQYCGWFAFVLVLGVALGVAAGRSGPAAEAQTVDNKTTRWLAASVTWGQSQDAFMLFDSQTNRILAYSIDGSRRLNLLAVREVSYDMKMLAWGEQKPTVQDVKKLWEEEERKMKEKPEEKENK